MLKIKDIEEYIEDSMLDTIFNEREDEVYRKTQKDNERISKITEKYSIDYDRLISIIKALLPHFKNTRETIIKALEEYLMRENLIMAYENEKSYKTRILWWNKNNIRKYKKW